MTNHKNAVASLLARDEYEVDVDQVAAAMLRRRGAGLLMLVPSDFQGSAPGGSQDDPGPGLDAA
jgi:hypothetical protein